MSYTTKGPLLTPFQELQAMTLGRFLAVAYLAETDKSTDYVLEQLRIIRRDYLEKDAELNNED